MKQLSTIILAVAALTLNALAADKPNIVFIFADDAGIEYFSCYGSDRFKGKTPNIDALAKSGTRFERSYAAPLCGPSRCLIMTGRYGFRTGGVGNQSAHNASYKTEPSLAKSLKQAGYATGMAGKWRQMSDSPGDWGFDEFVTDNTASGWFWQKTYNKNGKQVDAGREVYCPDVCMDFTKDFFKQHRDKPFYFYFSSHLVHGPILRTPDTKPGTTGQVELYDDNMAYLDKQVGELIAELKKLGLYDHTLIVFSVDNGTAKESGKIGGRQINGHKGTVLEGGSRVPLIASWKGVTPEGKVVKDLTDFTDFFPTFVEVAGGKMPEGVKFDGKSFAPQLRGNPGNPRDWIFVQLNAKWYARNDGWKLNEAGELYDMTDAPFVEKLVAADAESAGAKAARKQLQGVLDELNPAAGKKATEADGAKAAKKAKRKAKRDAAKQ